MNQGVYLDWNATTPAAPEVLEAMREGARTLWSNPSSVHRAGRRARAVLEDTREQIAERFDFDSRDVFFTGSGTEANNLALASAPTLLTSRLEHPSVTSLAQRLSAQRKQVIWLPVAPSGEVTSEAVARSLETVDDPSQAVVAVMAANHETGVIQPLKAISREVVRVGARLHVDAVQVVGKASLEPLSCADSISITPHKFRGPKGIAALLWRGAPPSPFLLGGAQERGIRPGTQDAVAALGFAAALQRASTRTTTDFNRLRELRDQLEKGCVGLAEVNGSGPRLAHVSNLSFSDYPGPELVAALDLEGIFVSSGSACSAGTSEPSPVVTAMSNTDRARRAVRFSLGETTTAEDIKKTLEALSRLHPSS